MTLFGLLVRGHDEWGDGAFHASRDEGRRLHEGIDLVAWPRTPFLAPLACRVVREAAPYPNDPRFSGLLLDIGQERQVKVFYIAPIRDLLGGDVAAGTVLGHVQDLRDKYRGITPHVHVELWSEGKRIDPAEVLGLTVRA